jgi:hypothetical protein
MGGSLICECCFLLRWAKEQGHSPLGLSGISMGGYMVSCIIFTLQGGWNMELLLLLKL